MIQTNKSRRRHLLSSSCHRTPRLIRQKVVDREATLHRVHLAVRSTSDAPSHQRLVEVFSCLIAMANPPVFTVTADSVGQTTVQLWLPHLKTVIKASRVDSNSRRTVAQGPPIQQPQDLHKMLRIRSQCLSIKISRKRIVRLSRKWWLLPIMLTQIRLV